MNTTGCLLSARFVACCAATVFCALVAVAVGAQPSDADFVAARDAYRAGDAARLERIAPQLKGHLLEPYVGYWRIRIKLDEVDPERARAFLEAYAGTPLADRLRGEWLKSLGMRAQWSLFAEEYPKRIGEDSELACYAIQWQRYDAGDGALEHARQYWLTGQDQPESCQVLFAAMLAQGLLTAHDIWTRFRLAHEAGNFRLAAHVAAMLPVGERPAARDLDRLDRNPLAALSKGDFRFSSPGGRELALYALDRAAKNDAAAAHEAWTKWRARLSEADRLYGNLLVAYSAARQLLPTANDWFRDADGAELNDLQKAWRVRAALRTAAWSDVANTIDAMSPTQAQDPAWRYWKARALVASGQQADATRLYGGLAAEHHFYGFLAAESIGASIMPVSEPLAPDPATLSAFGEHEAVQRVIKLTALDMRPEAQREWLYIVRDLDDDGLLLAAEFALRNRLYDRSINTAERTQRRHDFGLRYPTPYRVEISDAARQNNVDEALLFGLARQESRFIVDVVSGAGAVGLTQLMPPTAKWVAGQVGRADFRAPRLDDPALNAQLGAYYFRHVLDRLDDLPVLAAAAYNAGPGRANAWRGAMPLEGAIYAETIPFNETRDYVKKLLANAMFYQAQLGLPYVALKDRLGTVMPRGENGAATAAIRQD